MIFFLQFLVSGSIIKQKEAGFPESGSRNELNGSTTLVFFLHFPTSIIYSYVDLFNFARIRIYFNHSFFLHFSSYQISYGSTGSDPDPNINICMRITYIKFNKKIQGKETVWP